MPSNPSPSLKGSFGGGATVAAANEAVRRQRGEEAAQAGVDAAAADAETAQEKKIEKEVDARLPKLVASALLGEVSYSVFRRAYQSVWDQIAEKRHLLVGRIVFETQVAGAPVTVRSMTQREQQALAAYQPPPPGMSSVTAAARAEQIIEYGVRRLVVQLVAVNGMAFPAAKLSTQDREKWENDAAIRQAYDTVQDWDPMVANHLLGLLDDLDQAKYFALVENLRNP